MHYCFANNLQPTTAANVVSAVQSYCFSKEQDVQLKPQKPENSFVQRVSSFNIGPNDPVKNTTLTNSFPIQGLAVQRPPVSHLLPQRKQTSSQCRAIYNFLQRIPQPLRKRTNQSIASIRLLKPVWWMLVRTTKTLIYHSLYPSRTWQLNPL